MINFGETPHQEDMFIASEDRISENSEERLVTQEEPAKDSKEASLLKKELTKHENVEDKLKACIAFMAKALSSQGSPKFKEFWEGKRECLELFKQISNSRVRSQLWTEYSTLSNEAKRLKEIKDEQSSFAAEQISLAIGALEQDLANYEGLLSHIPTVEMLHRTETLKKKKSVYNGIQIELNLLSTLAARINALRKELVKTEMRLGVKSKLFDKLSACGDKVFPRRKDLVKKISEEFTQDVNAFVSLCLEDADKAILDLYKARDEIKALQTLAKELTLNSQSFSETRIKLSECWDKVKELEKLKKKEFEDKKVKSKEALEEAERSIEKLSFAVAEGKGAAEVNSLEAEIMAFIKDKELTREDFKEIRAKIQQVKKPFTEKLEKEELERKKLAQEEEAKKKAELEVFKDKIGSLPSIKDVDVLSAKIEELTKELGRYHLSDQEKDQLEKKIGIAKDNLADLKQKQLCKTADEKTLDSLHDLLEERQERRQVIKANLENYRKHLGGSGFDFEKAMYYQEALEIEKAAFEKVCQSIEEIEKKIDEIEG